MNHPISSTFFTLFLSLTLISSTPDRYFKQSQPSIHTHPQPYLELTLPLPSDHLPPSCSHTILAHSFANTINSPPTSLPYTPPPCPPPYSHVSLHFTATCKGEQYDRIAALWLGGAELLRTSTAEPTQSGIFWNIEKDVTRYSSLFTKRNLTVTMMLENLIDNVFTGVYHVNVSLLFYKPKHNSANVPLSVNNKLGLNILDDGVRRGAWSYYVPQMNPADLIIPISDNEGERKGFWFKIECGTDVRSKRVEIPSNTRRVVLEVYVSFHGNDEFWYSNPPDNYIKMNNLSTGRGNGAYREVYVTIDGQFVGSVIPFPVIFTGGINPLFWEPIVGIGAFDLPSYEMDLTPFLGVLLDGESHSFGIGVNNGISFWLVDANLHLWLDHESSNVQAKSVTYHMPSFSIKRSSNFNLLDGLFKISAKRKSQFVGWVNTKEGNLTTIFTQKFRFKNSINFQRNGTYKSVQQRVKANAEVKVVSSSGILLTHAIFNRGYPLSILSSTQQTGTDAYLVATNVTHSLKEKVSGGDYSSQVYNSQDSGGWMAVKDHDVLAGEANTKQSFSYRDEFGCYSRNVVAVNSKLVIDNSTYSCLSSS